MGQGTKEEKCKKSSTFSGSKTIHLRDDEPEDEPESSWLPEFVSVSFFY